MKQLILFSLALAVQSIFAQNKSIILGRPSDVAITASILFDQNVNFYLEFNFFIILVHFNKIRAPP
jgi:hypothetical protein